MQYLEEKSRIALIRKRILLVVLLGVFITGVAASLSTSIPFYISARSSLDQVALTSVQSRATSLEHLFEKYQDLARQFTSRSVIRDELDSYAQGLVSLASLTEFTEPKLGDAMRLSAELLGLVRLGLKGEEIVRIGDLPVDLAVALEPVSAYQDLTQPKLELIEVGAEVVIRVAANIFARSGSLIGQDVLYFSSANLAEGLSVELKLDEQEARYLANLTTQQRVVYVVDQHQLVLKRDLQGDRLRHLKLASGCTECPKHPEDKYENIIFYTPLKGMPWALVSEVSVASFYAVVREQAWWLLVVITIMLLAAAVGMGYALQPLTKRLAFQAKELAQSTEELRLVASVFNDAREAIAVTDAEMRLVKLNAAFTQILGFTPADVLGKKLQDLFVQKKAVNKLLERIDTDLSNQASWQGEIWYLNSEGEALPVLQSISVLPNEAGEVTNYIHIFNDITESKAAAEHINYLAHYDHLTDLPNRTSLNRSIKKAITSATHQAQTLAVLFMDLDHFKEVNDTLGHPVGDLLLQAVAKRLKGLLRDKDILGRLSGDEFLVLLDMGATRVSSGLVAEKIIAALLQPFDLEGHAVKIGVSVGIALYPEDGSTADELIKQADAAMYRAKEAGRNTYRYSSAGV